MEKTKGLLANETDGDAEMRPVPNAGLGPEILCDALAIIRYNYLSVEYARRSAQHILIELFIIAILFLQCDELQMARRFASLSRRLVPHNFDHRPTARQKSTSCKQKAVQNRTLSLDR